MKTGANAEKLTVGALGVVLLARRVQRNVKRPSEQKLSRSPERSRKRGVSNGLEEFMLDLLGDGGALEVLALGVERGDVIRVRGTGLGDEDLILGEMAGVSVVLAVLGIRESAQFRQRSSTGCYQSVLTEMRHEWYGTPNLPSRERFRREWLK